MNQQNNKKRNKWINKILKQKEKTKQTRNEHNRNKTINKITKMNEQNNKKLTKEITE